MNLFTRSDLQKLWRTRALTESERAALEKVNADLHREFDAIFASERRRAGWKEFATYFVLAMLFGLTIACWLAAAIWGS